MEIKRGATRVVILTSDYAIKIPNYRNWKCFLGGILANLQEREFGRCGFTKLAPVLWSSWGGFIITMPRVNVKSGRQGERCLNKWLASLSNVDYNERLMYQNLVERKPDSVGYLNGELVAVDYG